MQEKFIKINCPLCMSNNSEIIYKCYQETGSFVGRIYTTYQLCLSCGFIYLSPIPSREKMNNYYEKSLFSSGSTYHDMSTGSKNYKKNYDRKLFYGDFLLEKSKGSLLEIGCSSGDFLELIDAENWEFFGLEPSPSSASLARAKGLNVKEGFIESFFFTEKNFDVVCAFSVLEHIYDINNAMLIMTNLLKDNGYLWIEIPDTAKPVPQIAEFFCFEHFSHFTRDTIKFFLNKHGFGDIVFDENVVDSRLRLCAIKLNKTKEWLPDKNTIKKIREIVYEYAKQKMKMENDITIKLNLIVEEAKKTKSKIAIYGAGAHTSFLMNLVDFSDTLVGIVDSDHKKQGTQFMRWNVYDQKFLEQRQADLVIISSKAFQDEIYKKIECYQKSHNLKIIKLYNLE